VLLLKTRSLREYMLKIYLISTYSSSYLIAAAYHIGYSSDISRYF